jgi:phage FluMu protein Com
MTEIKPTLTFEIKNSRDLFIKLLEEYSDFDKQHLSSRFAMNCAINSWHLMDWTYQEFYKNDLRFQDSEIVDTKGCKKIILGILKYQQYLNIKCPELEYMRLITNGTKHCLLKDSNRKEKTAIQIGDFSHKDFYRYDFYVSRFLIEIGKKKVLDFEKTLLITINFWGLFLIEHYK